MKPLSDNAHRVLEERYFRKEFGETSWEDVVERMMNYIIPYLTPTLLPELRQMLLDRRFLPNSPTIMNMGAGTCQLSACFVLPVDDSIESIFTTLKDAATIFKSGGGVGINFSNIRPKYSLVKSSNGMASGPISFMHNYDAMAETVKQGGTRRGAFMAMLHVRHPDIMDFIRCKREDGVLSNMNISVIVDDKFMEEVDLITGCPNQELIHSVWEDGPDSELVNHPSGYSVNQIWYELVEGALKNADPGIVFERAFKPHKDKGDRLIACNPCGEQFLPAYGSCNLGSIDLAQYVHPAQVAGVFHLDTDRLYRDAYTAAKFLDAVITVNKYPLPEIEKVSKEERRIGLGIMGLAHMLWKLGLKYDSKEGREMAKKAMRIVHEAATVACPNSVAVTTIAPTGTLSMIADTSSGCEPVFAKEFTKTVMDGKEFKYLDPIYAEYKNQHCKDVFKTAMEIAPYDHIRMQAALQEVVDNSISKTINMPASSTWEDVSAAYFNAWDLGCKGITVYVDGSKTGQVLTTEPEDGKVEEDELVEVVKSRLGEPDVEPPEDLADLNITIDQGDISYVDLSDLTDKLIKSTAESVARKREEEIKSKLVEAGWIPPYQQALINELPVPYKLELEDELPATRYRFTDHNKDKVYLTVCTMDDQPVEVFAKMPTDSAESYWAVITRLISLALRFNIPLEEVVKQLRRGSKSVADSPAKVARILERYIERSELSESSRVDATLADVIESTDEILNSNIAGVNHVIIVPKCTDEAELDEEGKGCPSPEMTCPECGDLLRPDGSCNYCPRCGYSGCA